MTEKHLSVDRLRDLVEGDSSEDRILRALTHLGACAQCRLILADAPPRTRFFFEELLDQDSTCQHSFPLQSYTGVLDSVFQSITEESDRLDREREIAPSLLAELQGFSLNKKLFLVRNARRFQSWAFAECLLDESRGSWTEDPVRSEELARVALQVGALLPAEGFRERILNDLKAEALSYIANCRRITGDFRGAAHAFESAYESLSLGSGDAMERARLLDLEASFLRDRREFGSARQALSEVISEYRDAGEVRLEAKALLGLATLFHDTGNTHECLPLVRRASRLLEPMEDPWLLLIANMQLIHSLVDVGQAEEAHKHLPEVRRLAREAGNRFDRSRLLWIEGLICRSLGKVELAEEALKQVREGFIAAEIGYDVALVSLDLAMLYLESGRTAEVKDLAAEMLPQFAARQIQREALAAISLFEQAARQERATVALVQEVASTVKEVRSRQGSAEG